MLHPVTVSVSFILYSRYFPPAPADLREPYSSLSRTFYASSLPPVSLIWTDAGGGRWETISRILISDDLCHSQPDLKSLLVDLGLPVACHLPRWLELLVAQHSVGGKSLSPSLVRQFLRRQAGIQSSSADFHQPHKMSGTFLESFKTVLVGSSSGHDPNGELLPHAERRLSLLLEYLLSDLEVSTAAASSQEGTALPQVVELSGLPLLPLSGGTLSLGIVTALSPNTLCQTGTLTYLLLQTPLEHQLAGSNQHISGSCLTPNVLDKLIYLCDKSEPIYV